MNTITNCNLKVDCNKYFQDIESSLDVLRNSIKFSGLRFDCIVATKRSGLIMGAYISNKLNIPMFTTSEIGSIPNIFHYILLVDDKIWRGRQFRKYTRQLQSAGKFVCSMCLYIEGTEKPDLYVEDVGTKVRLFYER